MPGIFECSFIEIAWSYLLLLNLFLRFAFSNRPTFARNARLQRAFLPSSLSLSPFHPLALTAQRFPPPPPPKTSLFPRKEGALSLFREIAAIWRPNRESSWREWRLESPFQITEPLNYVEFFFHLFQVRRKKSWSISGWGFLRGSRALTNKVSWQTV